MPHAKKQKDVAGHQLVEFLAPAVTTIPEKKIGAHDSQQRSSPRLPQNPDSLFTPVVVANLTSSDVGHIRSLPLLSRQMIYQELSQIHAHFNPLSGFTLTEHVALSVKRILNCATMEDTLELPKRNRDEFCAKLPFLPAHTKVDLVRKVFESVMESVVSRNKGNHFFSPRVRCGNKPVTFRTYWYDTFLLYRQLVFICNCVTNLGYKKAIEHFP